MRGTWDGYYKYSDSAFQKALGFDRTNFVITIHNVDKNIFKGTVTDDQTTGGMDGIGRITGTIHGNTVKFTKHMPYGLEFDLQGDTYNTGKKHPTLYYSGTLSKDGRHAKGIWKFGIKIYMLLGILPIPYRQGTGTWEIKLRE